MQNIQAVQEVVNEDIAAELIISSAKNTHGSGGPTSKFRYLENDDFSILEKKTSRARLCARK